MGVAARKAERERKAKVLELKAKVSLFLSICCIQYVILRRIPLRKRRRASYLPRHFYKPSNKLKPMPTNLRSIPRYFKMEKMWSYDWNL